MHDQNSLLVARQMIASGTNVKLLFQGLGPQLASFREALGKYSEALLCSTYWDENVPFRTSSSAIRRSSPNTIAASSPARSPITLHRRGSLHRDHVPPCRRPRASSPTRCAMRSRPPTTRPSTAASVHPEGDGDELLMGGMIGQVQKSKLEIVYPKAASTATAIYPAPPWDKKACVEATSSNDLMNLILQTLADGMVLGGIFALAAVGFR